MPLYRAELLAKKPLRYAALIHDVSQVLHLPFDYDDGSYARDRSGYNFHGTIYGATLVTGKIGMSRRFDGVDDYVEVIRTPPLAAGGAKTVMAWVMLLAEALDYSEVVDLEDAMNGYSLIVHSDEKPHFWIGDGVDWLAAQSDDALSLNTWYHLAGVHNGVDTILLYVNGALKKTQTQDPPATVTANNLEIGTYYTKASRWFNGIIDEVRIYNRALSADEIRMLMYRR